MLVPCETESLVKCQWSRISVLSFEDDFIDALPSHFLQEEPGKMGADPAIPVEMAHGENGQVTAISFITVTESFTNDYAYNFIIVPSFALQYR